MTTFDREACQSVLDEVLEDRRLLHTYYGERNFPDGTSEFYEPESIKAARNVRQHTVQGTLTWRDLMMFTAISATTCENDPEGLRDELVELVSLVVEWIEAIDRRDPGA